MTFDVERPRPRLRMGVTGHRTSNALFARHEQLLHEVVRGLFERIEAVTGQLSGAADGPLPRLHSPLAFGADSLAVDEALARGWEVFAPLPFGCELNIAINAHPASVADAQALLRGERAEDATVAATADDMRRMAGQVRLFELADEDARVTRLFLDALARPDDRAAQSAWSVLASERAAVAVRVMIEQSDLLLALWDGVTPGAIGGTRHTIGIALEEGIPVLWVDVRNPARVTILQDRESLDHPPPAAAPADIDALVRTLAQPPIDANGHGLGTLHDEAWHGRSRRRFHAYRRIERMFGDSAQPAFGSLVQHYERPDLIADGSAAGMMRSAAALPGASQPFLQELRGKVLARFALADGISTQLSDSYRASMILNFLLSAAAIVIGVAYLPFASAEWKWPFAAAELLLLLLIVSLTATGRRGNWHRRWFETRRVAEYLRHAPVLLLLGVARPRGRWPTSAEAGWPEQYARHVFGEIGLPRLRITADYLRTALVDLLQAHVRSQCEYHRAKAVRLARVHHNLDRASGAMFLAAVLSVATYLGVVAAGALGLLAPGLVASAGKAFTFLGVALPATGGAFAGIRYFGDFERFSAISEVTAEKLDLLDTRIRRTLEGPDAGICFARVANLAHAMDEIVVSEIESWQSVFAAKNIAVPV